MARETGMLIPSNPILGYFDGACSTHPDDAEHVGACDECGHLRCLACAPEEDTYPYANPARRDALPRGETCVACDRSLDALYQERHERLARASVGTVVLAIRDDVHGTNVKQGARGRIFDIANAYGDGGGPMVRWESGEACNVYASDVDIIAIPVRSNR